MTQSSTNPVKLFFTLDDYYTQLPSDGRLFNKKYQKFSPRNAVSEDDELEDIEFNFPKLDFPLCYDIANLLLFVRIKIVDSAGKDPDKTRFVGGINGMLNSLFRTYFLSINQMPIEEGHGHFMLSYIGNLMTFTEDAQKSWMSSSGWSQDTYEHWNDERNVGLEQRHNRFRKNLTRTEVFSNEGACLMGHFDHCLTTLEKSLPPETQIEITLRRTNSQIFLHEPLNDGTAAKSLKYLIKEIYFFMPVEHLSDDLGLTLRSRWEKEPITYHYRTLKWNTFSIPNQIEVCTNLLYPDSLHPIRVYAFILEDKVLNGDIRKSPFELRRKWLKPTTTNSSNVSSQFSNQTLYLKNEIDELKSLLLSLKKSAEGHESDEEESAKNKGPGKNTRSKKSTEGSSRRDSSWRDKLAHAFGAGAVDEEGASVASSSSLNNFDEDIPLSEIRNLKQHDLTDGDKYVWLRSMKLEINGSELDQIPDTHYDSNAIFDFVRLNLTNETLKSLFGNNINYEKYMNGFYVSAWDLSTSQTAGISANVLPMILTGTFIHKLLFKT